MHSFKTIIEHRGFLWFSIFLVQNTLKAQLLSWRDPWSHLHWKEDPAVFFACDPSVCDSTRMCIILWARGHEATLGLTPVPLYGVLHSFFINPKPFSSYKSQTTVSAFLECSCHSTLPVNYFNPLNYKKLKTYLSNDKLHVVPSLNSGCALCL